MIKTIDPAKWHEFLAEFSERNRGRRARFEAFSRSSVREEGEEAVFEKISMEGDAVTVTRADRSEKDESILTDEVGGVRGISVQYDSDNSENTLEFMNANGDMTVLHFESLVDGDS